MTDRIRSRIRWWTALVRTARKRGWSTTSLDRRLFVLEMLRKDGMDPSKALDRVGL